MSAYLYRIFLIFSLVVSLAACGGGGSGSSIGKPEAKPGNPEPVPGAPYSYSTTYQSSGNKVKEENGIILTSSGVQAIGKSTVDQATSASGMTLSSAGLAEVRINKGNAGLSSLALLLSNLGISWDGATERPLIVETFNPAQGRTELDDGAIRNAALPESFDLGFWDYATKGKAGTQAHYANNRYFPRDGNPPRCEDTPCPTEEVISSESQQGNWRSGGSTPDFAAAVRLHEDGDVHGGNAVGGGFLPGSSGPGIPFPGAKGYRSYDNWSYRYGNLTAWFTQDTVNLNEWARIENPFEHNLNRRGVAAFGAVTEPAAIPSAGTATYTGLVDGWYAIDDVAEPVRLRGTVTVTADFATRNVAISIDADPISFSAATKMGVAGGNQSNYLTGPISNAAWSGGVSARYMGPVSSGAPEELGGAFSLSGKANAGSVVAGFIALKQ